MDEEKKERLYVVREAGVVALVFLMVGSGFSTLVVSYQLLPRETSTIASTTYTTTREITNWNVTTFTFSVNNVRVVTVTNYTKLGLPAFVTVEGSAATKGIGSSATQVQFLQIGSNITSLAQVSNGRYSVSLKNGANYDVYIVSSGTIGGGKCSAGGLVLYSYAPSIAADWSC